MVAVAAEVVALVAARRVVEALVVTDAVDKAAVDGAAAAADEVAYAVVEGH